MPLGKVGVAVDNLKHTFLERRLTTTATPSAGGALVNVSDAGPTRQGQISSSLLSKLSQEYNNVEQRRARSALTHIVRKSASPAVIRLYSASIEEPGPLKSLKPKAQGKSKKLFTARPKAHVDAFRDSRRILALAAERGKLIPAVVTHRKATELVVDTRPKHVGVIPMFEKRILESGMPPPVHEEPLPYPANPYRASSPRNEPELVYGPTGVSELLTSCLPLLNRARAEGALAPDGRRGSRPFTAKSESGTSPAAESLPVLGSDGRPITPLDATLGLIIPSSKGIHTRDGAITPTKRGSPPGSRPNSPDRTNSPGTGTGTGTGEAKSSPRGSFHFSNVFASAMRQHALAGSLTPAPSEAEELLKASHKSGLPPTRNTLSARKRLLQVKVHLHWKRATEDATSSLVSEASVSLSRQNLAASINGAKDFRSGGEVQGLGDKDLARGAFVAHRKGIVKDRFNK
jgi:hypothetical protein